MEIYPCSGVSWKDVATTMKIDYLDAKPVNATDEPAEPLHQEL